MQIPILSGIYTDENADFRTAYPRNLVPVPKSQGISSGYLRPAPGLVSVATGPGIGRGGTNWDGVLYRVMGSSLLRVAENGSFVTLGDVGGGGRVRMDRGFDRLAIAASGKLFYLQGDTLTPVTDPDLGLVLDVVWIGGYFITTDGTSLVQTELNDPTSVNPLKYGSSEADPDPIVAVDELRDELYALNRYSIEAFSNIGGNLFAFQRIDGALVTRGVIGRDAYAKFLGSFAFVGGGRTKDGPEPPSVWLMTSGDSTPLSTREIDQVLQTYTEAQLAEVIVEARVDKKHQLLFIHLPDQTLVHDAAATAVVGEPVWYTLTSSVVGLGAYRARNFVWAYNRWNCEDPTAPTLGQLVDDVSTHYGEVNGWDFSTAIIYNEGRSAVVWDLELIALTGRVAAGTEPVIWTSYSDDGETWSQERPAGAGKRGDRGKRIAWRRQGHLQVMRIQKFRGTSDAHLSFARLEANLEPLSG